MKTAVYIVFVCLLTLILARSHQSIADDTEQSANSIITTLQAERSNLIAELGLNHPRVKAIDAMIATTAIRSPAVKKDVTEMNEVELRQTVHQLLTRVNKLEQEVFVLKERRPKTELLGR